MNITKTTVHSNPEGEGKLVSKKKKKCWEERRLSYLIGISIRVSVWKDR